MNATAVACINVSWGDPARGWSFLWLTNGLPDQQPATTAMRRGSNHWAALLTMWTLEKITFVRGNLGSCSAANQLTLKMDNVRCNLKPGGFTYCSGA